MSEPKDKEESQAGATAAPAIDPKLAQEVFEKLLAGETVTDTVETHRGVFELKYPLGRDFVEIDRRKAVMRGGVPAESFDEKADANMEAYASLDVVIVDSPEWWKKLTSASDCPDQAVITELYRGYLRFTAKVRTMLSVGDAGGASPVGEPSPQSQNVGGGLFSRLTFRPKAGKPNR